MTHTEQWLKIIRDECKQTSIYLERISLHGLLLFIQNIVIGTDLLCRRLKAKSLIYIAHNFMKCFSFMINMENCL